MELIDYSIKWLDGLALYGHEAQNDRPATKKKVQTWLNRLCF